MQVMRETLGAGRRRVEIYRATESDLDGILALQTAHSPSAVARSRPVSKVRESPTMTRAMPLVVARSRGRITGCLMTTLCSPSSVVQVAPDKPLLPASGAAPPS